MRFWILLAVPRLGLGCRASPDPVAQAPRQCGALKMVKQGILNLVHSHLTGGNPC